MRCEQNGSSGTVVRLFLVKAACYIHDWRVILISGFKFEWMTITFWDQCRESPPHSFASFFCFFCSAIHMKTQVCWLCKVMVLLINCPFQLNSDLLHAQMLCTRLLLEQQQKTSADSNNANHPLQQQTQGPCNILTITHQWNHLSWPCNFWINIFISWFHQRYHVSDPQALTYNIPVVLQKG